MKKVINTEKKPIKLWLDDIEDGALDQAKNLANLPFAFKHIAIMPDSHLGYGMPIGGVMATKGVVIPNAVGVDIGCGMCAVKTSLTEIDIDVLKKIMGEIRKAVPVGFNKHKEKQDCKLMPFYSAERFCEERPIVYQELNNAMKSLGTLGGGNHFIEIQKGDDGHIWIMIHSGSRNLGLQVANHYNKLAKELNSKWHSKVDPKWDLAFLPLDSEEGQAYLGEMQYCVDYALANRKLMMERIKDVLCNILVVDIGDKIEFDDTINIAHNYASKETSCDTCIDNCSKDKAIVERLLGVEAVTRVQDFLNGYRPVFHSCGELTLLKRASSLKLSPSQNDALAEMIREICSLDLGLEPAHNHFSSFCPYEDESSSGIDKALNISENKFGLGFCHLFGVGRRNCKQDKKKISSSSSHDLSVEHSHTPLSKSGSSLTYKALSEKEYRKWDRIFGLIFLGNEAYNLDCKLINTYSIPQKHSPEQVIVHRKGATLADNNTVGIIPGSQGTKSYIVRGLGNVDSFKSCSHGAGRTMGRKQAQKTLDLNNEIKILDDLGVIHGIRGKYQLDEAPSAYKDISKVMENQKDLVDTLVELTPLGVIKA